MGNALAEQLRAVGPEKPHQGREADEPLLRVVAHLDDEVSVAQTRSAGEDLDAGSGDAGLAQGAPGRLRHRRAEGRAHPSAALAPRFDLENLAALEHREAGLVPYERRHSSFPSSARLVAAHVELRRAASRASSRQSSTRLVGVPRRQLARRARHETRSPAPKRFEAVAHVANGSKDHAGSRVPPPLELPVRVELRVEDMSVPFGDGGAVRLRIEALREALRESNRQSRRESRS